MIYQALDLILRLARPFTRRKVTEYPVQGWKVSDGPY